VVLRAAVLGVPEGGEQAQGDAGPEGLPSGNRQLHKGDRGLSLCALPLHRLWFLYRKVDRKKAEEDLSNAIILDSRKAAAYTY